MAPKKHRRNDGATTSQPRDDLPYDPEHFPLPAAYEWFVNVIPQKKLIRERGLKLEPDFDDAMIQEVQRRNWHQFIRIPDAAVIRVVKEFYSMLKATDKDRRDCTVRFRGTVVSFDPERINAVYGTPACDGNRRLQSLTRRGLSPIEITNVICEGEVEWTMTRSGLIHKHFPLSCLSTAGLAWFKFICSRLLPCTHVSDITWDRAVLIYAIMTGVPIDLGIFIYGAMMRTSTHRSAGLWFPSLITTLCREAGMVLHADLETQPAGGYIIPVRQPLPPPVGHGAHFAGLPVDRQIAAVRHTQERFVRHIDRVVTQIGGDVQRLLAAQGLEISPLQPLPDDIFDIPSGARDADDDSDEDDDEEDD